MNGTDPRRVHADLVQAQADAQTAQQRVQALREQLDAALAEAGYPRLITVSGGESLYGTMHGDATPLDVVLRRLGVAA